MKLIPNDLTLQDKQVLLRPLQLEDFDDLKDFAVKEPDTWRFSLVSIVGEVGMKKYIEKAIEERNTGSSFPFIVFDKTKNAYAGSTRFYDIQWQNYSLQLGYTWYGNDFRGTGLNKHCKFLLLQYAFETLKMERVEFRADANNQRSIAAMQSIGCSVEGILRQHAPVSTGGRRNSIILSILKDEWFDKVKAMLMGKL